MVQENEEENFFFSFFAALVLQTLLPFSFILIHLSPFFSTIFFQFILFFFLLISFLPVTCSMILQNVSTHLLNYLVS